MLTQLHRNRFTISKCSQNHRILNPRQIVLEREVSRESRSDRASVSIFYFLCKWISNETPVLFKIPNRIWIWTSVLIKITNRIWIWTSVLFAILNRIWIWMSVLSQILIEMKWNLTMFSEHSVNIQWISKWMPAAARRWTGGYWLVSHS